ncbi:hypothetical protein NSQ91_28535 [Paenibacillus sp. FSL R7-0048]|uniref:hypothetical protein n=1 Tax=Paenibacillus TaxID=44249 RepID=UPI00096D96EB|nr:hypothetical protein [Paenibacillus odorifer]OMD67405.1 hypothetical protein BSK48_20105 [Paenibacillus odorifer]OMD78623.1 hypothetical protein BSK53_23405 [Paenibacillus odorifer]
MGILYNQKSETDLRLFILKKISEESVDAELFDENTELVDSKIISSISLINLLAGIEEFLDQEVVNNEFGIENFTSVNKIIQTVRAALQWPDQVQ